MVDLDTRTDEDFPQRFQPRTFDVENETAYGWYRLDVTANSGDAEIQLAELSIFGPDSVEQPDPEIPLESARSTWSTASTRDGGPPAHVGPRGPVARLGRRPDR